MTVNDVNKERIFEIFDRWATITALERGSVFDANKSDWLSYVETFKRKIRWDKDLCLILNDLKRIYGYLEYSYIKDFPKKVSDDSATEMYGTDTILDKTRFNKEQKIYDNWENITQKYEQRSEKAANIKVGFIGEMVQKGLKVLHERKKDKYEHFKNAQEMMHKQKLYQGENYNIVKELEAERDAKIQVLIEEVLKLIAYEEPLLYCQKIKKPLNREEDVHEMLLREAFNKFRDELIEDYKQTKIYYSPLWNQNY